MLLLTVVIEKEITEKLSHGQPLTRKWYLLQFSGPRVCVKLAILSSVNTSPSLLQMTLFSVIVKWEVTTYMQEKQKCDELQASVIYAEAVWGNCSPLLFHINYACTSLKIATEGVRIFLANESCPKFLQYIHWLKCLPFAPPLFLDHL